MRIIEHLVSDHNARSTRWLTLPDWKPEACCVGYDGTDVLVPAAAQCASADYEGCAYAPTRNVRAMCDQLEAIAAGVWRTAAVKPTLYLYKITQSKVRGYDTYSDAVVVATNAVAATHIHPSDSTLQWKRGKWYETDGDTHDWGEWCGPQNVTAVMIGTAAEGLADRTIVCASYHAG